MRPERTDYLIPRDGGLRDRPLPHNLEMEQALLGAIMVNNEALVRIRDILKPEHFYEELHARIYETCRHLIDDGKVASPVTVRNFFPDDEALKQVGGGQYLARLTLAAVTVLHAVDYADAIAELARRRAAIRAGLDLIERAVTFDMKDTLADILSAHQARLAELDMPEARNASTFAESMVKAMKLIEQAQRGEIDLCPTGLPKLDSILQGGLWPGKLYILAARPSMGKSALAVKMMLATAHDRQVPGEDGLETVTLPGRPSMFYSLEMGDDETAMRVLSMYTEIKSQTMLHRGALKEHEWRRLAKTAQQLAELPISIDERAGCTIEDIAARARTDRKRRGTGLIVIDHAHIIEGTNERDNEVAKIGHITAAAKRLAKELHVPVVLLSQLSRACETRENKRPMLSDLRNSGSIEQDADVVAFLYRHEYYLERELANAEGEDAATLRAELDRCEGQVEINIAKQRGGPTGVVTAFFDKQYTRFRGE